LVRWWLLTPTGDSFGKRRDSTMNSLAYRTIARVTGTLSAAALGVSCLAGAASAAPASAALPDAGNGFAVCGTGTTCSVTLSQSAAGRQVFEAFVGDDVPGNGHPRFVLVSSNQATVTWWWFTFHRSHRRG
jgi:hypothetical protein